MKIKLPRDLYKVPADSRINAYLTMEAACREHVAQRIDLTYQMYLEVENESKWRNLITDRFAQLGGFVPNRQMLYDDVAIFTLLRRPAPAGLGLSLAQITAASYGRMRVLSQQVNAPWALANRERVLELLADPTTSEAKIRDLIAAETGREVPEKPAVLKFALSEKAVKTVGRALDEVTRDLEGRGAKVPENRDELLLSIIAEWRRLKKAAQ